MFIIIIAILIGIYFAGKSMVETFGMDAYQAGLKQTYIMFMLFVVMMYILYMNIYE